MLTTGHVILFSSKIENRQEAEQENSMVVAVNAVTADMDFLDHFSL